MKNKILLSLLVSGLLSVAAMADGVYVGVEYGMASNETEMDDGVVHLIKVITTTTI